MREVMKRPLITLGFAALMGSAAVADEMTFTLAESGGTRWITAEGEMTEATPDRFLRFLQDNGLADSGGELAVYFDSPGGNLMSGIKLGGLIRKQGLHTSIGRTLPAHAGGKALRPGKCASACSFAFLGGTVRSARGGELGVHQFYDSAALADPTARSFDASAMSTQQLIGAIIINFVVRMGVDPRVASIAASTMPEDLYFFSDEELADLKVNWDPRQFGPWTVGLSGQGVIALSRSNDQTRTLALYCRQDDGITRVRVAGLGDGLDQALAAVRDHGGLHVFGWIVDAQDAVAADLDGDKGLEFVIDGFHPDSVVGRDELLIGEDSGSSGGTAGYPDFKAPGENAAAAFAVAMRNCV